MRRIESIGVLEEMGSFKNKQITLVDNDGGKLKFLLWGEQVLLANLFRYSLTMADCFANSSGDAISD